MIEVCRFCRHGEVADIKINDDRPVTCTIRNIKCRLNQDLAVMKAYDYCGKFMNIRETDTDHILLRKPLGDEEYMKLSRKLENIIMKFGVNSMRRDKIEGFFFFPQYFSSGNLCLPKK